jgi:cytochrome b
MTVAELKKYKDSLYSALCRDLAEFEKNFLLIAAGLLAFSITFIKEIVDIHSSIYLYLLFLAWGLIASAIALMMIAFVSSANGSDRLWFHIDGFMISLNKFSEASTFTDEEWKEIKTSSNKILQQIKRRLKRMRYTAIALFIAGTLFFAGFVGVNLYKENAHEKQKDNVIFKVDKNKSTIDIENYNIIYTDTLVILKKKM